MEHETNDEVDISTPQEEAEPNTAVEQEETSDDYKEKFEKAEELAKNYRIRAEKAEKLAKTAKVDKEEVVKGDISMSDFYALTQANVPEEDISDVREYAQLKNIPLKEALKSNVVKSILKENAESRQVASAANVGSTRKSSGTTPDDVLIRNAQKGEVPSSDEDMRRLAKANMLKRRG